MPLPHEYFVLPTFTRMSTSHDLPSGGVRSQRYSVSLTFLMFWLSLSLASDFSLTASSQNSASLNDTKSSGDSTMLRLGSSNSIFASFGAVATQPANSLPHGARS